VSATSDIEATVAAIVAAPTWNKRVILIRRIPEEFGKAQHQEVYSAVAKAVYVPHLAPDFAYVHWRPEYELEEIEHAYGEADALTRGFKNVDEASLAKVIQKEPATLRIFRLLLGLTTQEFASATDMVGDDIGAAALSSGAVKSMESGRPGPASAHRVAAAVVDRAMRAVLFTAPTGGVRSKLDKPDTAGGWETVRKYASEGVSLPILLHQRHYGGAFRQLLDATSSKRGDVLEDAVGELFDGDGVLYVRTGSSNQEEIVTRFGLTVRPAPDFVVYDVGGTLRAILECKVANDGGTARDKAARFAALRSEASRLGGIPVFAVLAGLGWRRAADALGPVVRDADGRVFTIQTLGEMLAVQPFPALVAGRR